MEDLNKEDKIIIPTNEYQTPITQSLLETLPEEERERFLNDVTSIPFIKNLISPNRPRAKDLPRDAEGRIIVDLENPHILEDMDYFRPAALFFEKYGCYTLYKPNSNPNSEYRKFWKEELRRCWEGYVRPSDGEWVTGYMYWFLNYSIMKMNIITKGKKKALRVDDKFPLIFEGIYWRTHYLQQAREAGQHAIELAKRGAGKAHPYDEYIYTPQGKKQWKDIKVGDFIYGDDGKITKVIQIPFDDYAPIYEIELSNGYKVKCSEGHLWRVFSHCRGEIIASTKELLSLYKRPRKVTSHNPKGIELDCTIPISMGAEFPYKQTKVDPYTFGLLLGDGCFMTDSCYFTQIEEDLVLEKEYIPYNIIKWKDKYAYRIAIPNWSTILKEYKLKNKKSEFKFIPEEFKYNSKAVRIALLKGLLDSDGTVSKGRIELVLSSKKMIEDVQWICSSLGIATSKIRIKKSWYYNDNREKIHCLDAYRLSIYSNIQLFNLPRKIKLWENRSKTNYAQSKYKGHKIVNIKYVGNQMAKCVTVDNDSHCYLINNFIVTHNSFFLASIMSHNLIIGEDKEQSTGRTTILCAYQKEYLKEDKDGTLSKFTPDIAWSFEHTPFPHLLSKSSSTEMSWIMGYKDENNISRGSRNTVMGVSAKDDSDKLRGKRGWILFEEMGTFSGLLELYNSTRRSVEEGDYTFALLYLVGTANNNESDFSSAKALLYHPKGYNIKEIKNVFDRPKQGKSTFGFFFPAYINRAGYYNKDGVSDVVGALVAIYKARHTARSTDDPKTILRVIAEDPITPAEAIIQVKNAYFPVQALTERKIQIDDNPNFYDDTYIGTLILNSKGEVEFKPTNDTPIREYPVKNDTVGALEIFNMPEKDSNNKVFENRYILGHDPVDNDQADSSSLTSTFVFDLWKDCIVAEYTGRHSFAEENYEMLRLLCIFYNGRCLYESNKKGCYAYFYKKHSLQYLAETPEYLRDKQLIKYSSFGSNAYGVNASSAINSYADSLLKDWFLKPIMETIKDENGELKEVFTSNLFTIKNRALLEEAIAYNPEINVDRIRAMGMVMLYREEFLIKYGNNLNQEAREEADKNDLCNDSFFVDNFDNRHSIWE